ncbi:hypothetical protein ASC77_19565 [Nocardioides sp. Root1257]|nr:hypothetical protein ASC77_19565 [Nocardioides sp. Root1257]KRC46078.1 hypothetical protein ASE24_15655 [Nocardioides sp. Root224]
MVGDEERISALLRQLRAPTESFEVRHASDSAVAVRIAVEEVQAGRAEFVVKGSIPTAALLRGMLGRERLGTGRVASHLYVIEAPAYRNRVLALTDAGVNIAPDLTTKADIVRNAVDALAMLGITRARTAVLSAVEMVKQELSSATDAALLTVMGQRGQLGTLDIDGPLSIDAALLAAAARDKALSGEVAGNADLLVAPAIDAANMVGKALIGETGRAMGVVVGARVPVALPSRGDSLWTRRLSLRLASYLVPVAHGAEPAARVRAS